MHTTIEHIYQKQYEVFLSVVSNTVVNPRTVMIHFSNTSLTDRTVMTMRRFYGITLLALSRQDFI
jgi:hypothetical protein